MYCRLMLSGRELASAWWRLQTAARRSRRAVLLGAQREHVLRIELEARADDFVELLAL